MAANPIKCTLKTFGTFSTPTFAGVGEPFADGRQRKRPHTAKPRCALRDGPTGGRRIPHHGVRAVDSARRCTSTHLVVAPLRLTNLLSLGDWRVCTQVTIGSKGSSS